MAGIDKIYGTQKQYDELRDWLQENNQKAVRHLYPIKGYDLENRAISNFPKELDMWLLDNCPLKWVTDRIKEQYNI